MASLMALVDDDPDLIKDRIFTLVRDIDAVESSEPRSMSAHEHLSLAMRTSESTQSSTDRNVGA